MDPGFLCVRTKDVGVPGSGDSHYTQGILALGHGAAKFSSIFIGHDLIYKIVGVFLISHTENRGTAYGEGVYCTNDGNH